MAIFGRSLLPSSPSAGTIKSRALGGSTSAVPQYSSFVDTWRSAPSSPSLITTIAATGHVAAPSIATYSGTYRALLPPTAGGALPLPEFEDRFVYGRATFDAAAPVASASSSAGNGSLAALLGNGNGRRAGDTMMAGSIAVPERAGWPWWVLLGAGVLIGVVVANGK